MLVNAVDKREMMMLLGQTIGNATAVSSGEMVTDIDGSEGYAIEDRGMVDLVINTISEVDDIVKVFDKEGAASEYALYVNRAQDLAIDDMLAAGQLASGASATTVGAAAFGSFQNGETALTLGFRSFARVDTFHKHDWKLLNDQHCWLIRLLRCSCTNGTSS